MRTRKLREQPAWSSIKLYVEGQCHRERRRFESKLEKAVSEYQKAITKRLDALDAQVETVANEVSRLRREIESDEEPASSAHD